MKKLILLLAVTATALFAAEAPKFYHDFKSGKAAAQEQNKMMMIMIHVQGCPECQYMKDVVFKQKDTSAFMSQNFVNVALDFKETEIPSKYPRIGVPTFYITDKEGNIISQQIGGSRGNKFLKMLQKAKKKHEG